MIHSMKMPKLYFPFAIVECVTPLEAQEMFDQFRSKLIDPDSNAENKTDNQNKKWSGSTHKNGFKLWKVPAGKNEFLPVVYGYVTPIPSGTKIRLHFFPDALLVGFFLYLAAWGIPISIHSFVSFWNTTGDFSWLAFIGMAWFIYPLVMYFFRQGVGDLMEALEKSLSVKVIKN